VPFSWVTGDEAYGGNPGLREWLGKEKIPYVLGIACNAMIATAVGAKRADGLAALVPAAGWQRLSCADGSKGPGLYDWALIGTDSMLAHAFLAVTARAARPSPRPPEPVPACGNAPSEPGKRGPDACGQIFAPPRTCAPPAFITDDSGRDLIPLTAGEARRLFNLHTRVTHPDEYHVRWSDWRRYREAAARRSHYARRAEVPGHV
jgi:hypothetical protein